MASAQAAIRVAGVVTLRVVSIFVAGLAAVIGIDGRGTLSQVRAEAACRKDLSGIAIGVSR